MRTGKILNEFLLKKNKSQKEIAEEIGITQSAISQILKDKIIAKDKVMQAIINYLRLSKEEELEVWKAWTLDRGEPKAVAYFEKLDKENKKLKKILSSIKEL